ncbi:unnamed protein product [Oikopleura dioica]|uniref:Uncharacterized protein n=1 Tax=Oikopleura dioica TaxID=34765 RepID=E4XIK4_OIKDI|nr:unnamed protein product [Oikopleura dioica]CBY37101.1 unnamed protein product [Oikopleura dioica]CBY40897.1 unnamed protein product [Oikopleura dioica]
MLARSFSSSAGFLQIHFDLLLSERIPETTFSVKKGYSHYPIIFESDWSRTKITYDNNKFDEDIVTLAHRNGTYDPTDINKTDSYQY